MFWFMIWRRAAVYIKSENLPHFRHWKNGRYKAKEPLIFTTTTYIAKEEIVVRAQRCFKKKFNIKTLTSKKVTKRYVTNFSSLIGQNMLKTVMENMLKRAESCIASGGRHVDGIIFKKVVKKSTDFRNSAHFLWFILLKKLLKF